MKAEVYSWRLSEELKLDLEREARLRKVSVSSVLETAVHDWLKKSNTDAPDDQAQRKVRSAAARCLGVLAGLTSRRAERAREVVHRRLSWRYAR
jgi:post-segregation antitoxin (ccd killing protein)